MGLEIKRLRDLPGVLEIEALYKSPSHFDYYNIRDTEAKIDAVSVALFSICGDETSYDCFDWSEDGEKRTRDQWEALMANASEPYSETRTFWEEAAGWDLTDGKGRELQCAHYFTKQIIAVEFGDIEGVELTADGSGPLPHDDDHDTELTEEQLAERLDREAKAFLLRRN